jgi:hypothetical protein
LRSIADRAHVPPLLELLGQAHRKFLINLKDSFMHGGWQLFSPTLLVEVEGSLHKRCVSLYVFTSVWMREEREKHTCALAHLIERGEVRRWARAHDVRVNGLSKSGKKPRRSTTSFYRLFLLQVHV